MRLNVLYPPGCYGWYLSTSVERSILSAIDTVPIDSNGSAHELRIYLSNVYATHYIEELDERLPIISIVPDPEHLLDYVNNVLVKEHKNDELDYLLRLRDNDEWANVAQSYGFKDCSLSDIPRWIVRENLSFFLPAYLKATYDIDYYSNKKYYRVDASSIISNIDSILHKVSKILQMDKVLDHTTIHKDYLSKQHSLNRQIECDEWITSAREGVDAPSPCRSIFDEAYVQMKLMEQGINLACFGIDEFPKSSLALAKIFENT